MATTYGGPEDVQEQTTQTTTTEGSFQVINLELRRLLEARRGQIDFVNSQIARIHNKTDRIITGKIAKPLEFVYESGKPVKVGTSYHIHYTTDIEEHFMTGDVHNFTSKIIIPIKPITEFGIYDILNHQDPLTIKGETVYPTEEDYEKGVYKRYFARKANDKKSPGFEISKGYFEMSPLYIYVSIGWHLKGTPDEVYNFNSMQIERGKIILPLIYKILNPHQFFIPEENYTLAEIVKQRLGIETSKADDWSGESRKERQKRIRQMLDIESVEDVEVEDFSTSGGAY